MRLESANAEWIQTSEEKDQACPVFRKKWNCKKDIAKAELTITALGVYEAVFNGERVGDYVLAPGWTAYQKRLQYQTYDITKFIRDENEIRVTIGKGWFSSPMPGWTQSENKKMRMNQPNGMLAEIRLIYTDGSHEVYDTGEDWEWGYGPTLFSEIYDGETFDAGKNVTEWKKAVLLKWSKDILIPQEGELLREQERISAKEVLVTPAGEIIVDFGQVVTGYVEFTVNASEGDKVKIQHGEVLDRYGNFYNENYRTAKAEIKYICKNGLQTWHPKLTFFGFRYLKLVEFPGKASPEQFTAIVIHSDMKRTGKIRCSDEKINQLFSNIIWSQKGNFLEVPLDCPQRDERLGWAGDAGMFVKCASYNFDVEKFYKKWLNDLAAEQAEDGGIGQAAPNYVPEESPSSVWGDAITICPWQLYMTYGDKETLNVYYDNMKRWADYITNTTDTEYLWTNGSHLGDWLAADAPKGTKKGLTRLDFVASAYYAHSVRLVAKAGKVLGKDVTYYEELLKNIIDTFQKHYTDYRTQTEHVLAVYFELAEDLQKTTDDLAELIKKDGMKLTSGFVGTAFVLHVLSKYGYTELAYTLLFREDYPSWLHFVNMGATTIWEHWDSIDADGEFWDTEMNSFNHYSFGIVADWLYEKAAGIQPVEENPGYERIRIAPHPDKRLKWLEAEFESRRGTIYVRWSWTEDRLKVEINTPSQTLFELGRVKKELVAGKYCFWIKEEDIV